MNDILSGDNLEVMKSQDDEVFQLCYIDPPFYSGIVHKRESGTSFNDKWNTLKDYLDFMQERIKEIYRILSKDGSFYLHCDHHGNVYLKLICDEIFGIENLRREIVWNTGTNISGFKSKARNWIRQHDTIYFYSKSNQFTFNKQYTPWDRMQLAEFNKVDESGRKYKEYSKRGEIHRQYLDVNPGIPIGDVWNDIPSLQFSIVAKKEGVNYPTQKPKALLRRIIKASSNEGDNVLDAFCGSGTTLVVAKELNRNFMGIDENSQAIDIAENRIAACILAREIKKNLKIDRWLT